MVYYNDMNDEQKAVFHNGIKDVRFITREEGMVNGESVF